MGFSTYFTKQKKNLTIQLETVVTQDILIITQFFHLFTEMYPLLIKCMTSPAL